MKVMLRARRQEIGIGLAGILVIATGLNYTTQIPLFDIFRFCVQLVSLGMLLLVLRTNVDEIHQAQLDRQAWDLELLKNQKDREDVLFELSVRADNLAETSRVLAEQVASRASHEFKMIHEKLDENMKATVNTSETSTKAETTANETNQKIQQTNERVKDLAQMILMTLSQRHDLSTTAAEHPAPVEVTVIGVTPDVLTSIKNSEKDK